MKQIKLRNSELVAMVDDEDFDKIGHLGWYAENVGHTFYAMRYFYDESRKRKSHKRMHREIMGTTDPKIVTDHIDRNGLNNQRSNLRSCTQAENRRNTAMRKRNTIGYRGVSIFRGKVWKDFDGPIFRARIHLHKKEIAIGYFKSAEQAARAYDVKCKELHGQFGVLNFPDPT